MHACVCVGVCIYTHVFVYTCMGWGGLMCVRYTDASLILLSSLFFGAVYIHVILFIGMGGLGRVNVLV